MKKTILLFTFLSVIFGLSAQVPQSFKYQAVARNNDNAAIKNQKIGLKVELRQGTINGSAVYTETFRVTSNNIGVFSVDIGTGTPVVFKSVLSQTQKAQTHICRHPSIQRVRCN